MTFAELSLASLWRGFIDAVAASIEGGLARFSSERRVVLTQERDPLRFAVSVHAQGSVRPAGSLALGEAGPEGEATARIAGAARGGRVEIVLNPEQVLLRQLPLPAQAGSFLDNILRTQIDRLAPWPADSVAYGHAVLGRNGDTITVALAAMPREAAETMAGACAALKPRSITVLSGPVAEEGVPAIVLLRRETGGLRGPALRRALSGLVAGLWALAMVFYAYASWQTASVAERSAAVQARIAAARAAAGPADPAKEAELRLVTRKLGGVPATLVLEDVARLLPDDSSLTAMEISGDIVRLTGVSPDAAGLVGRIEQSSLLSDASFFAPTTRRTGGAGEQFNIEARLKPRQAP